MEFFQYAITCILYQRGIYPAEDFDRISKYGLVLHVAKEEGLITYLKSVLSQLKGRLSARHAAPGDLLHMPCLLEADALHTWRRCLCLRVASEWLTSSEVQKLVVVVNGMESHEVLERWVFNVETAREAAANPQ